MALAIYLFWINVFAFGLFAYNRHNIFYGKSKIHSLYFVLLSLVGGLYGVLVARLLFGSELKQDVLFDRVQEESIPGWCEPIDGVPGLPNRNDNKPIPGQTENEIPSEGGATRIEGGEIIVLINTDFPKRDMADFVRQFKNIYPDRELYRVSYYNTTTRMMRLNVPIKESQGIINTLNESINDLDFMLADNTIFVYGERADYEMKQMGMKEYYDFIQAMDAWNITQGSPDVTVAIIDSSFCLNHPCLSGRVRESIHIVNQTRDVAPSVSQEICHRNHGTHVAGIAVGCFKEQQCDGIASKCTWMPIALGEKINSLILIEGIMYAIYKGADVVNLSIGAYYSDEVKQMAVDDQLVLSKQIGKKEEPIWDYVYRIANERKCIIVWAAGNENLLISLDSCKRNNHIINVSAVDDIGKKTNFSNFGHIENNQLAYSTISAPGVNILSCFDENEYGSMSGTSMAAPFVTGTVALMKSLDRSLSVDEVISILQKTGMKTMHEEHIGPVIRIKDALQCVKDELVGFDELLNDQSNIVGRWEATRRLVLEDENNNFLDEILLFFEFVSSNDGKLILHSINKGDKYEALLNICMKKNITK